MRIVGKFILISICVMGIAELIPGVEVFSFWSALSAAIIISILNLFVKPILIVFTIPVTILTMGLFLLVINGLIIWIAGEILAGFTVGSFGKAILFSILLSLATYLVEYLLPPQRYHHRHY